MPDPSQKLTEVRNAVPEKCPTQLFAAPQISPQCTACVVIPVKDEEDHITQTLAAFAQQADRQGAPLDRQMFEILLLINNCTDSSAARIEAFRREHPELAIWVEDIHLPQQQANIGYVRRQLMEAACRRLAQNGGGVILTTDGDTRVAPDWISQTRAEISAGADAVGGRILFCPEEEASMDALTAWYHYEDEKYQLLIAEVTAAILQHPHDPAPTHHQHFNGSFAVTTDCYEKSGGIPEVTHLEDCAFFEQLQRIDAQVRHSPKVVVYTSARYSGRSEVGLSNQLRIWRTLGETGGTLMVASGDAIVEKLRFKKRLMDLWSHRKMLGSNAIRTLAEDNPLVRISAQDWEDFRKRPFFGAWYAQVVQPQEGVWRTAHPDVPVAEAIIQLQEAVGRYAAASFSHTSIR